MEAGTDEQSNSHHYFPHCRRDCWASVLCKPHPRDHAATGHRVSSTGHATGNDDTRDASGTAADTNHPGPMKHA
jgi:hypothetical protein